MKKVALIHTIKSVACNFDIRLKKAIPNIEIYNIWDEFIVKNLSTKKGFEEEDYYRLLNLLKLAEEAKVDLILVTCSSLSIAIDQLKHLIKVPIYKIDEAMLKTALEKSNKITIIATAETTIEPTSEQLLKLASQYNKVINIEPYVIPQALKALKAGDRKAHDKYIFDKAYTLKNQSVIILAQASMAHLEQQIMEICHCDVLSSPRSAIEFLTTKLN